MRDPFRLPEPPAGPNTSHVVTNQAVIQSQRPLTHDTDELVIALRPGSAPLHARAGQFATIKFPGIQRARPYSFARDPWAGTATEFTFYIRRITGGEVSDWLAQQNRRGAAVELTGPLGRFGIDESTGSMLCVAGGSGMSAVIALLEYAAAKQVRRDCYFFYGARTSSDLYGTELIDTIAKQWHRDARFSFIPVLSEERSHNDWDGLRGFVTDVVKSQLIDSNALDIDKTSAFFCGPPPMIAAGTAMLVEAGLSAARIFSDGFEDASSAAPVIDNRQCVLCDECLLVKPINNCIVETAGVDLGIDGSISQLTPIYPAHSSGLYYNMLVIDPNVCIRCYACVDACPHGAISPTHSITKSLRQKSPVTADKF